MEKRLNQPQAIALSVCLLVVASLALTLGFACALPLAAFAAISALLFEVGAAVGAVLAVWLVNQAIGFGFMHYPMDATTFAWGGALGLLGLASLAAARATLWRLGGLPGAAAAFLAAFAAYEGLLFVLDVIMGLDPTIFLAPVVLRIFAINAIAFGALYAARALAFRWIAPARLAAPSPLRA